MAATLACYDVELERVADLAGELDVSVDASWRAWYVRQWKEFANAFEFRAELNQAFEAADATKGEIVGWTNAPFSAWRRWNNKRQRSASSRPETFNSDQLAKARHAVLKELSTRAGSGWVASEEAFLLPGGACSNGVRVVSPSNAPCYFHDGQGSGSTPRNECVWKHPVLIYFGTWPWYHGGKLGRRPPGLRWDAAKNDVDPGMYALRIGTLTWQPEYNAKIDARQVYATYKRFRETTEPLLRELPSEPSASIYRDDLLLKHRLGGLPDQELIGPLGPLAYRAYNTIIYRFAAFFSLRRAMLNNYKKLPAKTQKALMDNPDPCLLTWTKGTPASNKIVLKGA